MSPFKNPIKKIRTGLSGLGSKLPDKRIIFKGTRAAALLSTLLLAGKVSQILFKKVGKKVDDSVAESKSNAVVEVKITINRSLEKFIFECVFRWMLYIFLIMLAFITAKIFHLRKDVLVAIVILGIYSFYAIKGIRAFCWYLSFSRINGFMLNPVKIMRSYLHKAILDRVQRAREGLSLPDKLAMNFFGPDNDKIARDITISSMQSSDLRWEAITRIGMWICGWIIYALIYEKLFLLVTGIDFKALWEPVIWPFHMILKVLST